MPASTSVQNRLDRTEVVQPCLLLADRERLWRSTSASGESGMIMVEWSAVSMFGNAQSSIRHWECPKSTECIELKPILGLNLDRR